MILANLLHNAQAAQRIIADAVGSVGSTRTCDCASALETAIITAPDLIPADTKRDLMPILGKYLDR